MDDYEGGVLRRAIISRLSELEEEMMESFVREKQPVSGKEIVTAVGASGGGGDKVNFP